jgi:DnaK suppressor protein
VQNHGEAWVDSCAGSEAAHCNGYRWQNLLEKKWPCDYKRVFQNFATSEARQMPTKKGAKATKTAKVSSASLHGFEPYKPKKGEEYMNEKQREHFKNLLFAWKRELMEEVDRTVTHMKDEAANFPDPADRATQEEEFSLELRTRDRERKLIKKIDKTIDRIDSDDYGFCDQCGIEIGIRRLEARPTATLCVDCKTLDEIKERQITGG